MLATFRSALSGDAHAKAFGLYGAVAGLSAALGVILGGVLTQYDLFGLSWRAIFLINVPIALGVLVAAARLVPESRPPGRARLDVVGAGLLIVSVGAIVYCLIEGRRLGWPAWLWVVGAAGVAGLVLLVVLQRRATAAGTVPLLQPEQFRSRAFSAGVLVQGLFGAGLPGFSLVFVLWLQSGQG